MSELNDIIKNTGIFLSRFNKTLWTGTFSTGNITVPNTAQYSAFKITLQGYDCIGFVGDDGAIVISHSVNLPSSTTQYFDSARMTVSGNTWTMIQNTEMAHYASSNHSGIYTISITKIVGLIPIVGGGCLKGLAQTRIKTLRRWQYGYLT